MKLTNVYTCRLGGSKIRFSRSPKEKELLFMDMNRHARKNETKDEGCVDATRTMAAEILSNGYRVALMASFGDKI